MSIGYKGDKASPPIPTPRNDIIRGLGCFLQGFIPMALAFLLCAGVSYVMGW